jgi:hypothetical protein
MDGLVNKMDSSSWRQSNLHNVILERFDLRHCLYNIVDVCLSFHCIPLLVCV